MPHPDPFDLNNSAFQNIKPAAEKLLGDASDIEEWHASSADTFRDTMKMLLDLATKGHVPSACLLGMIYFRVHETFVATGGLGGKFGSKYLEVAAPAAPAQIEKDLAVYEPLGKDLVTNAARFGYPPAREFLEKQKLPVPPKDRMTPSEQEAQRAYQQALARKARVDKALQAVAVGLQGFAQGMQQSAASSSPPPRAVVNPDPIQNRKEPASTNPSVTTCTSDYAGGLWCQGEGNIRHCSSNYAGGYYCE